MNILMLILALYYLFTVYCLQIHSYGKCLNNRAEPDSKSIPDDPRWPAIAQRRARKIKILSNYKFYLAFENAPIQDYVSEKVLFMR